MRIKSLILAASLASVNPAAHADSKDTLKMLSAVMMGGGLGAMITSCGKSSGTQGCQMGTMLAMMGGVGLLFGMQQEKPKEVRCYTDATGMQKVVMYGNNGQQVPFVQAAPGMPVAYPTTQLPPAYAQNLSGQVMQLCQQPQLLSTMNTAFIAPAPAPAPAVMPTQLYPVNSLNAGTPAIILPRSVAADPWARAN